MEDMAWVLYAILGTQVILIVLALKYTAEMQAGLNLLRLRDVGKTLRNIELTARALRTEPARMRNKWWQEDLNTIRRLLEAQHLHSGLADLPPKSKFRSRIMEE